MISCRDWWPWTKPGYITMTRTQSNNQWSGGIGTHAAPKNFECKNPLEISHLDFLGSRRHPPHWLSSKGSYYQLGVLLISAGAIEGYFEGTSRGKVTKRVLFLHDNAPAHRALATQKKLAYLGFHFLYHPILRIRPRRTTACSLDGKNNWMVAIFPPTRRPLLPRRPGWTDNFLTFFLSCLQKLEQRAKTCIELRGKYVE